jgi:CelD/BcsL family acetyltransferase involved in cellulose biosynthesis
MEVKPWRADFPDYSASSLPDLTALPREADGVYRPSERVEAGEPDWQISGGGLRYIESRFRRRSIDLTTGFDAYLSKFSGKTRSTFRRKLKKFREAASGNIDWRAYRSAGEMQAFHAEARQISARTYQEKLFDAGLPEDPDFVAGMLARAEAGLVRGFILFLGGAPIAYLYLPIADGRVIYGYLGFDPAYANLSPGTVLQLLALESLFDEGIHRIFDFTEGEGEHKRLFATHEHLCGNVYYLRPTLRNQAVVRLHLATRRLSDFADRQLVRRNLKVRLKHYLRGQRRISHENAADNGPDQGTGS